MWSTIKHWVTFWVFAYSLYRGHKLISNEVMPVYMYLCLQSYWIEFIEIYDLLTVQCISVQSLYITNLTHNSFFMYVYLYSLHVSGSHVPIIRRTNCINTTSGICHCVDDRLVCRFGWDSSGELIVSIRNLVYVSLCRWSFGVQVWVILIRRTNCINTTSGICHSV